MSDGGVVLASRIGERGPSFPLESTVDYVICTKHAELWRSTGMRLRANAAKHTLRLVEVTVSDGY